MNHQTALLLIDIQNDYFEGGANPLTGSLEASLKANELLNYFRINHIHIFHIRHISARPGSTFFLPETKGSEIHSNVQPLENEKIIIKHYPNSFRDTNLHSALVDKNITDLVICGMMTHMCVDASVRAAKDLEYHITLISDACATKNLEIQGQTIQANEVHHSFLAALNYFYSSVRKTSEFLNEMA